MKNSFENNMSYFHSVGKIPFESLTIGQMLERAAENWPNRPFIISKQESKEMTFSEIYLEVEKLANGLLGHGLNPGDRLGIYAPNSSTWLIIMMAAAKIGVITVAINPACTPKELEHCLIKVGVKSLAMPTYYKNRDNYSMLQELIRESNRNESNKLKNLESIILMNDTKLEGTINLDQLRNANYQTSEYIVGSDDKFSILFTSGTTGLPKAAIQTHFSYLNNSRDIAERCEMSNNNNVICLQLPFFHAFGLLTTLGALQFGSTLVLPFEVYNIKQSVESIIQNKCTVLTGTPTMYVDLVNYQRENNIKFDSPKIGIVGGSPCSPQLFNQMKDCLGINSMKSVFGMTEILGGFVSMPNEDIYQATETVGRVLENLEVKVVNNDGHIVPFGTPGELMIRSYANMVGYWGDETKTKEMIDENSWIKTGDQFILEADGYGKICGRFKDMIIRGGENIIPKEIEDFLNTHPDVIETQVFGVKDDRMGEEICASVRIRNGSYFDYEKLRSFCKGSIANYKIPKILKIVDNFPKTTSGKIQKFKLKEMVENGKL